MFTGIIEEVGEVVEARVGLTCTGWGRPWKADAHVLVEHRDGRILFETGLHPALAVDPAGHWSASCDGERIGLAPHDVRYVLRTSFPRTASTTGNSTAKISTPLVMAPFGSLVVRPTRAVKRTADSGRLTRLADLC